MEMNYNKKQNFILVFVMGQLCAKLFNTYENCIRVNTNNIDFADIKQVITILSLYFTLKLFII